MQTSDLYHHFLAQLQPLLNAQQSCFSVALSGGVDSVVLLHLIKQAQQQHSELKIEAVYVNHGLSKNAIYEIGTRKMKLLFINSRALMS